MDLGPFLTLDDSFVQKWLKSYILANIETDAAKSRFFLFSAVKPFLLLISVEVGMKVTKSTSSLCFKMVWSTNCKKLK